MSSANIGWLFYKDYYNALTNDDYNFIILPKDKQDDRREKTIKEKIDEKIKNIINQKPTIEEAEVLGSTRFTATTTYPGLLLGSGNAHALPPIDGQAILGFHFDYTSGLPVIQGSSIKGVLRSAFKHKEYIKALLGKEIEGLEDEIFVNGDIFFDATISKADGKILGDDFITPHKNTKGKKDGDNNLVADELCSPNPLRFIKVLPDVSFRFDFELKDGIITKEEKIELFKDILKDLGLGAKTNVGYGKFEPHITKEEKAKEKKKAEEKKAKEKKAQEKKTQEKKAQDEADRLQAIEDTKTAKKQKAKDGINSLLECKTLPEAFKLLKDSFGSHPKPTKEQKEIIQKFFDKQNRLSKGDIKTFKKYGVS